MAALQHVGAVAPGLSHPPEVTKPQRWQAQWGFNENRTGDSEDCAAKQIATATARAALLGIEVHQIEGGAWLLRHARGASIGAVRGLAALDAAVGGFEAVQRDMRELVQRMRGAA